MKIEVTWDRPSFRGGLELYCPNSFPYSSEYPPVRAGEPNPDWGIKGNKIDDPVAYIVNEDGYRKEIIELKKTADYGKYKAMVDFGRRDFGIVIVGSIISMSTAELNCLKQQRGFSRVTLCNKTMCFVILNDADNNADGILSEKSNIWIFACHVKILEKRIAVLHGC
jgi:hypothetical protein